MFFKTICNFDIFECYCQWYQFFLALENLTSSFQYAQWKQIDDDDNMACIV